MKPKIEVLESKGSTWIGSMFKKMDIFAWESLNCL